MTVVLSVLGFIALVAAISVTQLGSLVAFCIIAVTFAVMLTLVIGFITWARGVGECFPPRETE
jgi:hypothetical protein